MSYTPQDYQQLLAELAGLADEQYRQFHQGLVPGATITYGVRVPQLRRLARAILRQDPAGFLSLSAPGSYEEIMIRGFVIAGMKLPLTERLPLIESFLPLIGNWAVCDTFCSSLKLRSQEEKALMWQALLPLFQDSREYYARFALVMFLGHFVEEPYVCRGLGIIEGLPAGRYYVDMASAWAVSVCYVKFPALTRPLLERQALPPFVQNKAIQKIRESYRVPAEDKAQLVKYKLR